MALIDFDKFLASFITEMKKYSPITSYNIPGCIKKALKDQGFEYKDGEIVKNQDRIAAESEDEKIRKELIDYINRLTVTPSNIDKYNTWIAWLEKQRQSPWSEEDEDGLGDALWCCKQAASIAKDENDMGNVWYAEQWLKAIKNRIKGE